MCRVLILVLLVGGLNAQRDKKFFRKDYKFLEATQSFYKIHTLSKPWEAARSQCEAEGATLFYPHDQAEADAVIAYWNDTQPFESVFIGIQAFIAKGVFETVDNNPISDVYEKWSPGEPNDVGGNEDCVQLKKDGQMNDVPCTMSFAYICKKSLSSLQWNVLCNMPRLDYTYGDGIGKCYKFHLQPRSWTDAYAVCSAEQSYLAVIDSHEEADYLKQITAQAPKDKVKGDFLDGAVLLGFHNRNRKGWATIKGAKLEDSGYSNWGHNQPDGEDNELCGSMFYNGEYNDLSCDAKALFICEHDIDILGLQFDDRVGHTQ